MLKVVSSCLIVKDDFNNLLLVKKKAKRGQISEWSLVSQKRKGKEEVEKTVHRAAKDVLKTVVFDLASQFKHSLGEDECISVYSGILKEKVILDKAYDQYMWVNKNRLEEYKINKIDKEILNKYLQ